MAAPRDRDAPPGLAEWLGATPPLVWVAAGLVLGDAAAGSATNSATAVLGPALIALGSLLLLAGVSARRRAVWRRVAVAVLAVACGHAAAGRVYQPRFAPDHVAAAPMGVPLRLEGVLLTDADVGMERARLLFAAERLDAGDGWRPTRGQLQVTLRHTERSWQAGDRIRASAALRRPRNFGNPGEFDYAGYLARRGVYVTAFADSDADFVWTGRAADGVTGWIARWRRGVGALFSQTLSEPQAGVLSALIIGTEAALPRELRAAFARAGVSHVLSISGLHVGLVAAAGYEVFRWLLARSRWLLLRANVPKLAVAFAVVPVLLYAGIAGSNVATLRSLLMILVFLGAIVVDRQRHFIVSLAAAAIVVVLTSPGAARDISFQLTFVAVLGLMLGMERFWPWWRAWEEAHLIRLRAWPARLYRPLAVYGAASLSALAATTPLMAWHFNQVSIVALAANAVVVPLLGSVAVALGLLAALLYALATPLARVVTLVAGPFVALGVWLVERLAAVPYAAVRVITPTGAELLLLYAALFVALRTFGRRRAFALAGLGILGLADGVWWCADRYHRRDMRVTFLSVGQGDSAVVEFPGAEVMVIDGGGLSSDSFDVGERIIAPFLWSRKIAHVDYLVLSHPQWDHYGGLAYLAEHFSPREFWSTGASATSARFVRLERILFDGGVQRLALRRGARRRIGRVDALVESPAENDGAHSVNDQSLVLRLAFGQTRVLFTGDAEAPAEAEMVATSDSGLRSAVLKVPHHGSHTSSSPRFLDAVAPRLAVISDGYENRFGFPHPDVLRRYAARACVVARTDLDGAVQVRIGSDGTMTTRSFGAAPESSAQ